MAASALLSPALALALALALAGAVGGARAQPSSAVTGTGGIGGASNGQQPDSVLSPGGGDAAPGQRGASSLPRSAAGPSAAAILGRINRFPDARNGSGAGSWQWGGTAGAAAPTGIYNESQARALMAAAGYTDVGALSAGPDGSWQGFAHPKGTPRNVVMRVTVSRSGVIAAR